MTIQDVSIQVFGTADYQSMLNALHPSDALIRKFKALVKEVVKC